MLSIDDPELPGLKGLTLARLCRVADADTVSLMRLRYRAGKRAILHIATGDGTELCEGVLWFFGGDKARRLARRNKSARFDADTQALYERFPNDHRMPQIREFLECYSTVAPALLGDTPIGSPRLLRYRPGLSCTFCCGVETQAVRYLKLINDDSIERLVRMNRAMCEALEGGSLSVAPVVGSDPAFTAIAYAGAVGVPLNMALTQSRQHDCVQQTIDALRQFWRLPLVPQRQMTPAMLLSRAEESAAFVNVTAPECSPAVATRLARLTASVPRVELVPIHGDMKLEHVFLDADRTTLIDTESVSLGPSDYDLAQLYGRLWHAEQDGLLPRPHVESATADIRRQAGPGFDWCLDIVALRLAKFHAQRPAPGMARQIRGILERLD